MPRIVLVWLGVALAVSLIILILLVATGHVDGFDLSLRQTLLQLDPPVAYPVWRLFTSFGSGLVIIILSGLCILFFAARAEGRMATYLIFVMSGAVIIENALKYIVHRHRPDELFPQSMPATYSFPSGHALFALTFYISMAIIVTPHVNQRARLALWALTISFVVLVGASRVFLGVHYPIDVLGGFIAAALWLIILELLAVKRQ